MANSQHSTPSTLTDEDVTHFRHVLRGGRQSLTVEVVSIFDEGQLSPPFLTTHGNLDMGADQVDELVDALQRAQAVYRAAAKSWKASL